MSEFSKTVIVDADGNGDFKYINQAALALSSGGTIIVEQGTYTIDDYFRDDDDPDLVIDRRTITVPSNVSIIGRGNAVIEVKSNAFGGVNAFKAIGKENITISGFKIKLIDGTPACRYDKHLIHMEEVDNSVIEKLYVTDESSQGVGSCAAICFYGGTSGECTGNIIRQNVIEDVGLKENEGAGWANGERYSCGYGIFISTKCKNNYITNNIVSNCGTAIYFMAGPCQNVIANNIFKTSGYKEWVMDGDVVKIDDDGDEVYIVHGANLLIGQECNNNTFTGNMLLESNESHGLYLTGSEGCTICGNLAHDNAKKGFKFRLDSYARPSQYNTLMGNVSIDNGKRSYYNTSGFLLAGYSRYNALAGNVACDNGARGMDLRDDDITGSTNPLIPDGTYEVENNVVVGNLCHGNPKGGIAQDGGNSFAHNK